MSTPIKPFLTVAELIAYLKTQDQDALVFTNQNCDDFTEILSIDPKLSFVVENAVVYSDEKTNKTKYETIDDDDENENKEQEIIEELSDNAEDPSKLIFWGNKKVLILQS